MSSEGQSAGALLSTELDKLRDQNQEVLKAVKLSVFPHVKKIVTIPHDATISEAVAILNKHDILSAPVEVKKEGTWDERYSGLVSALDILLHILNSVEKMEEHFIKGAGERGKFVSLTQAARKFDVKPISDVIDSEVEPFVPWPENDHSLLDIMWVMNIKLQPHLYRVMVVETKEQKLVNVITQSSVCKYLSEHIGEFKGVGEKSLRELGLGRQHLYSVKDSDTPLDAFRIIREKKISAVPVIGQEGLVVGCISSKDATMMIREGNPDALMRAVQPNSELLRATGSQSMRVTPPAVMVKLDEKLKDVLKKLVESKVHRVFVQGDSIKKLGVISLTDVIKVIAGSPPEL